MLKENENLENKIKAIEFYSPGDNQLNENRLEIYSTLMENIRNFLEIWNRNNQSSNNALVIFNSAVANNDFDDNDIDNFINAIKKYVEIMEENKSLKGKALVKQKNMNFALKILNISLLQIKLDSLNTIWLFLDQNMIQKRAICEL